MIVKRLSELSSQLKPLAFVSMKERIKKTSFLLFLRYSLAGILPVLSVHQKKYIRERAKGNSLKLRLSQAIPIPSSWPFLPPLNRTNILCPSSAYSHLFSWVRAKQGPDRKPTECSAGFYASNLSAHVRKLLSMRDQCM